MVKHFIPYIKLIRADKPIGFLLLLWPTYWALWLSGKPTFSLLIIFTLGVFFMRSAGCVINDIADSKFDGKVKRTANRPLVTGEVSMQNAFISFFILLAFAMSLLLFLPLKASYFACGALFFACIYPFMKRFMPIPQLILGIAFSFGIPMVYVSTIGFCPITCWLLFALNITWTIAYDTIYAMVDKDDDLKIGINSSAILFGRFDKLTIFILQLLTLALWILVGQIESLNLPFYIALVCVLIIFIYQQVLIKKRDRTLCFRAFLNNNAAGAIMFMGLVLSSLC